MADKNKSQLKSWYSNRYQIVIVQRNILLLLTILSMVSVTISVIFVKSIISSKSLEPYVVEIEEKSGVPTIIDQRSSITLTGQEAVNRYFINKFIQAMIGYEISTYDLNLQTVRLLSKPAVFNIYLAKNYRNTLGKETRVEVRIKSIQFDNQRRMAQVRLASQLIRQNTRPTIKNELIELGFEYSNLDLSAEERLINPLGFQVTSFKATEENFDY